MSTQSPNDELNYSLPIFNDFDSDPSFIGGPSNPSQSPPLPISYSTMAEAAAALPMLLPLGATTISFPTIPILPFSAPTGSLSNGSTPGLKRSTSDNEDGGQASKKRAKKDEPELPPGVKVTEKSCKRCRERKVKCDRILPVCTHCKLRKEDCDLTLIPAKGKHVPKDPEAAERIAKLEARLAELESTLPHGHGSATPTSSSSASSLPDLNLNTSFPSSSSASREHTHTRPLSLTISSDPQPLSEFDLAFRSFVSTPSSKSNSAAGSPPVNIGEGSIDWRLAVPAMQQSLSQTLCDSFFESCCFLLPTFSFFRARVPDYRVDVEKLDGAARTAIAVFSAVGGRTNSHSAILGIEVSPGDTLDNPNAPFLKAGVRRENACRTLISTAYTLAFEHGLEDEATIENLAALLAVVQMSIFVELKPKRSRTLLRSALDQFKELQDSAETEQMRVDIKRAFAMAIYYSDALTSAYAHKPCLVTDGDLLKYFSNATIVVPDLPTQELAPILDTLLNGQMPEKNGLKTATHLLMCWTAACQRMFAKLVALPTKPQEEFAAGVLKLWTAVDFTRVAVQKIQTVIFGLGDALTHSHDSEQGAHRHSHVHETDFLSQVIRCDRDLLDLVSMTHVILKRLRSPGLPILFKESLSRIRKALKTLAFYAKVYVCGADLHMIFHHVFQMELNPEWTDLVKQRVGDPGGPLDSSEEVTMTELGWFVEGLQSACFYTPSAERRLAELQPRFEELAMPEPKTPLPLPDAESAMFAMSASLPATPLTGLEALGADFDFSTFMSNGSLDTIFSSDATNAFSASSDYGWTTGPTFEF